MRGSLPISAPMALALAACGQAGGDGEAVRKFDGNGVEVLPRPSNTAQQGAAIIDQANVLSVADKVSLEARSTAVAETVGRKLTVVLLRPADGQSLEQVSWAIAPKAGPGGPLLLVVDVETGAVRVDGAHDPAGAAAIARAISGEVKAGRVAAGVTRGLDQVAALGRSSA